MAAKNSGYFPPAGPQNPSKYPRIGPNYLKFGEQQGWVYSPRDDSYYRDQKSREELERYEEEQGLRSPKPKEPKQQGLGDIILPVAATGVTVAAANKFGGDIADAFTSSSKAPTNSGGLNQTLNTTGQTAPAPSNVTGNVNAPGVGGTPQGLLSANQAPSAATSSAKAPTTPNLVEVKEVGPTIMPDGSKGVEMSDGGKVGTETGDVVNPDGTKGGTITGQALAGLQVAGGAAQMYNGYRQYQAGEKLGGAANVAGGAFGAAAGAQSLAAGGTAGSLSGYVPGVGAAVAGAQIGQQMLNDKGSSEDRAAKSQYEAQKAGLLFIPGYGWAIYAGVTAADALSGGKVGQQWMRANKNIDKFNDRIDFGVGKNIRSKVFHQSTKGVQQMHTGQLLQQSDDPTWQNYVAGMRAQVNEGPKDPTKPFAGGQYATFDEYKKAGLQADDLTGVYGNLDAFKPDYAEKAGVPDWSKLNYEQQRYMTQKLIDANAYDSRNGEVVIPDKEKARRIYEQEAKTNFGLPPAQPGQAPGQPGGLLSANKPAPIPQGQTPATVAGAAKQQPLAPGQTPQMAANAASGGLLAAMPPRSRTVSPGLDKNGRRITY